MSSLLATVMTIGVRELTDTIPSMEVALARSVVGLAILLPLIAVRRGASLATKRLPLHVARGLLGVVAINCGFYALSQLPLATVTVLFFTAPLFVTIFAVPLLGEEVGWRRWAATAAGFVGALVVIRPGAGEFDPVMLVPVASSLLFALILIMGKKLSTTETPYTMMLYAGIVMTIGCLPPALAVWTPPTPTDLLLMAMVGLFGTARSYTDIRGYAVGEASFVAPFQYTRIVLATVAGYVLFAETPDSFAMFGAAIIIASTLYIAQREARLHRAAEAKLPEA
jgi:drug/metabolite transporter (DMT)-like permease